MGLERWVTGEHLVAAVTAERDLDLFSRESGQKISRHDRGIAEGLVEKIHELRHEVEHHAGRDGELVVLRADLVSYHPGVARLVEGLLFEGDGEALDGARFYLRHHRGYGARVDTAAQEDANRDVAQHFFFDRLFELDTQLVFEIAPAHRRPSLALR